MRERVSDFGTLLCNLAIIATAALTVLTGSQAEADEGFGGSFAARSEENIGTWGSLNSDPGWQEEDWAITRGPMWTYIRSGQRASPPAFRSMSGSFLAPRDGTPIAVFFSAEAYVEEDDKRVFVRALIDGVPLDPDDVVFSRGTGVVSQETRSFIFTGVVDEGLHTLEMQWRPDPESTAKLRDAAFLIRIGSGLEVITPPSGPNISTRSEDWIDVPGLSGSIDTEDGDSLAVSFSAESFVSGGGTMEVRALIDGAPAQPSAVAFATGINPQSRMMTFGEPFIEAGSHSVKIQWRLVSDPQVAQEAFLGDRSLVLAAIPVEDKSLAQTFTAPAGSPATTQFATYSPVPDLSATADVPANGEIGVVLSTETGLPPSDTVYVRLTVDGVAVPETVVRLARDDDAGGVHSHLFSVKHLPAGEAKVGVEWRLDNGLQGPAQLGNRSLTVLAKPPMVPDLIESKPFAPGNDPVDAEIGSRRVLAILWDPNRANHPAPPANDVAEALFGPSNSVQDYFSVISKGRFGLTNALGGQAVLGWYSAANSPTNYFGSAPGCGSDGGNLELRRREMVSFAAQDINFADFDDNRDGMLDPRWELAVLLVVPHSGSFVDKVRPLFDVDCTWMEVDGVIIPIISEWLTDTPDTEWRWVAHEFAHQILNLDDLYLTNLLDTSADGFSLMGQIEAAPHMPHLSGWEKLQLGWVTPMIVESDGQYTLDDVKLGGEVLILPRKPGKATDEFFLIENRQSTGAGDALYDNAIEGTGIAIWHIIEGQADNGLAPLCMSQAEWAETGNGNGRRGMRLVRPRIVESSLLWNSSSYDLLDTGAVCPSSNDDPADRRNVLQWADGTPSGYRIRNWSVSGSSMTFDIETP